MILNSIVAIILHYVTEFSRFGGHIRDSGLKLDPYHLLFGSTWLMMMFSESTEKDCVKERYHVSPFDSENLNYATLCSRLSNSWAVVQSPLRDTFTVVQMWHVTYILCCSWSNSAHKHYLNLSVIIWLTNALRLTVQTGWYLVALKTSRMWHDWFKTANFAGLEKLWHFYNLYAAGY